MKTKCKVCLKNRITVSTAMNEIFLIKVDLVKQVQIMKKELLNRSYRYVDNLKFENLK